MSRLPNAIDTFESFTASFDVQATIPVSYLATPAPNTTYAPYTLYARGYVFCPQDLETRSVEVWRKLLYFFDMYQEYRMAGVSMEWIPISNSDGQSAANIISYNSTAIQQRVTGPLFRFAEITLVQDRSDTVVRNSIPEYYQVREMPNAVTRALTSHAKVDFRPTIMTLIQANSQFANQNMPQDNINQVDSIDIDSSVPQVYPWLATKVVNASSVWEVNTKIIANAVKVYWYMPFNVYDLDASTVTVGMFRITYKFGFRYPDCRLAASVPNFIPLQGDSLYTKQQADNLFLNKVLGEQVVQQDYSNPNFLPAAKSQNILKSFQAQGYNATDATTSMVPSIQQQVATIVAANNEEKEPEKKPVLKRTKF